MTGHVESESPVTFVRNQRSRCSGIPNTLKKARVKTIVDVVCHFSEARYKKDRRELDKQINGALALLERNEPGQRAKFVKKADGKKLFEFNVALKAKTERLLGITALENP
jgi:hypothetical protein